MKNKTFPTIDEFALYLSDQKDIVFSSSLKSHFNFTKHFFKDKAFSQENLRLMLNKLRTTTELKDQQLKKTTLNKYIQDVRLIARYMGVHEFDTFEGYRLHEEEVKPLGDLISDHEAKRIAELHVKYRNRSKKQNNEINNKYRAALTLMRYVGTPPVDVCNLKWTNDKGMYFEYYRHKTRKHMIVPIVPRLRKYLDMVPHTHEYIFGSSQGQMKESTIREEIKRRANHLKIRKNVTCYSFRYMATAFSYMNCKDNNITHLADVFGHTVEVAKKHYNLVRDPQILLDALMTSHPGLRRDSSIDSIKRIILDFTSRLVDMSKFEIEVSISPKLHSIRRLRIS